MSILVQKTYAFIDSQNLNLSVQNDVVNRKGKYIKEIRFSTIYIYLEMFKVDKVFLFSCCWKRGYINFLKVSATAIINLQSIIRW
jgi:hypothetical protein